MLDEQFLRQIEATGEVLELNRSLIEKDFYLSKVLCALSHIENEHFRLIFSGGTCLAKGHRLVKRMSEDVDFKFQKKETCNGLSKNQYLKALKIFRNQIVAALENTEFTVGEMVTRNEGQYLRIELNYPSSFVKNTILRPHLLMEFTASEIRLPTQELTITTLIQDTLGDIENLESCALWCISVEETAAEKWVGLTRRIAASDRGYYPEDITLVRHIYDLSAIITANKLTDSFFNITKEIVTGDANQFKNQYPEYLADPIQEIQRSLELLKTDAAWQSRYEDFIDTMVYDQISAPNYANAFAMLEKLSSAALNSIK